MKIFTKIFARNKKTLYICTRNQANGSVAQLNRVLDYGSSGYRFESCRSHLRKQKDMESKMPSIFFLFYLNMLY